MRKQGEEALSKVNEMLLRKASHVAGAAADLRFNIFVRLGDDPALTREETEILSMADNLMRDADRLEMAIDGLPERSAQPNESEVTK